jgi:prophage antirepressor-like protein
MQNNIIPFNFGDHLVRVIKDDADTPWWVAKDVCRVLEHTNHKMAVRGLDEDERGVSKVYPPQRPDGVQVITINESGLYTLIIRSNKPEAKTFRRWITHDVLPSIRKTGSYSAPGAEPEGYMAHAGARKSGHMYFPMAKLVESVDKHLEGRAALKAINYFTGMPVDDLLDELDKKQWAAKAGTLDGGREVVELFLSDRCECGPGYRTGATKLYNAFSDWARENSVVNPISKKRFCIIVGQSFERIKSGTIFYVGLRLKPVAASGGFE